MVAGRVENSLDKHTVASAFFRLVFRHLLSWQHFLRSCCCASLASLAQQALQMPHPLLHSSLSLRPLLFSNALPPFGTPSFSYVCFDASHAASRAAAWRLHRELGCLQRSSLAAQSRARLKPASCSNFHAWNAVARSAPIVHRSTAALLSDSGHASSSFSPPC